MNAFKMAAVLLSLSASSQAAEPPEAKVAETTVPRIILHDILTNRVCIHESKLYSIGAKVMILGSPHECVNANPMTFGAGDEKWDMRWTPLKKSSE